MAWLQTSLLGTVQRACLFPQDSKIFVDMPVKSSLKAVMDEWKHLESQHGSSRDLLIEFVERHFDPPGRFEHG